MKGHKAVFINEPRLLEFKLLLLKEGIQAEFSAGVLICNNCVAIRRVRAPFKFCFFFIFSPPPPR